MGVFYLKCPFIIIIIIILITSQKPNIQCRLFSVQSNWKAMHHSCANIHAPKWFYAIVFLFLEIDVTVIGTIWSVDHEWRSENARGCLEKNAYLSHINTSTWRSVSAGCQEALTLMTERGKWKMPFFDIQKITHNDIMQYYRHAYCSLNWFQTKMPK